MWAEQYERHREKLIAVATIKTREFRATAEGKEKNRIWARERKRRQLSDPAERELHNARGRAWRAANPEKTKQFKHESKAAKCERVMARYAQKKKAQPAWVNKNEIRAFYYEAQTLSFITKVPHEVDHIIPLRGKTASGLHVPANLRVIPATMNRVKGNTIVSH